MLGASASTAVIVVTTLLYFYIVPIIIIILLWREKKWVYQTYRLLRHCRYKLPVGNTTLNEVPASSMESDTKEDMEYLPKVNVLYSYNIQLQLPVLRIYNINNKIQYNILY